MYSGGPTPQGVQAGYYDVQSNHPLKPMPNQPGFQAPPGQYPPPGQPPMGQPMYQPQPVQPQMGMQQPMQQPMAQPMQQPMAQPMIQPQPTQLQMSNQPAPNQPQMGNQQPMYQPVPNQPLMGNQQPMYQQQPVPMYNQGMPMMMPVIQFVQDPMALLATAKKASVKQKFEFMEVVTGCESPNQYYVSCEDQEGNKRYLFKAKENSSWCCRNCCDGASREFDLDMKRVEYTSLGQEKKVNFAKFSRPFKCTCCCCNRPEMTGKLLDSPTPNLGKVAEPCTVCDPLIQIFNKSNVQAYTITCDCCQCGYCCRNSLLGRCSEVNFEIFSGASTDGKPTGKIFKKVKGVQSAVGDADFYTITFPPEANPEDKVMLIGATIMIDYLYYEDKDDSDQRNRNKHRSNKSNHH